MSRHNPVTPNLITLGRLVLVPVTLWLLATGEIAWAFAAFVVAGLSDAADGWLAKRYHLETQLGAYLDPVADKLLIVCIFIALGIGEKLPIWLVITVVSRDVLIIMAVMLSWIMERPVEIKPLLVSKANTASQLALASVVLADEAFALGLGTLRTVLVWVTGFLTLASLASYLKKWLRHMSEPDAPA